MGKHVPYDCKFNSATCNSCQKLNNETCQCQCKNYLTCMKGYSQDPSTFICENGKYLKSIGNNSITVCDEIIYAMVINKCDEYYTNKCDKYCTNKCQEYCIKKFSCKITYKMDYYILHTVLLVIILLLIITIFCYHYSKHRSK